MPSRAFSSSEGDLPWNVELSERGLPVNLITRPRWRRLCAAAGHERFGSYLAYDGRSKILCALKYSMTLLKTAKPDGNKVGLHC